MKFLKRLRENWKKKREARKAIKQLKSKKEKQKQKDWNKRYKLRTANQYLDAQKLVDDTYEKRGFKKGDSVVEMIRKENEIPIQVELREELPEDIKKQLEKMQIGAFVLGKEGIFVNTPFGVRRVSELEEKPSKIQEILDETSSKDKKVREKAINELIQLALK